MIEILTPGEFSARFAGLFHQSAFRLELLDHYAADNEAAPFAEFRAGRIPEPGWREPWKAFVRQKSTAGARMSRVHVVTEPLTDYTAFEISCVYPANVEAGEDVRILPRGAEEAAALFAQDYWLFDSQTVATMHYDRQGTWLSVELTSGASTADAACRSRDRALAAAVPLAAYQTRINSAEGYFRERQAS